MARRSSLIGVHLIVYRMHPKYMYKSLYYNMYVLDAQCIIADRACINSSILILLLPVEFSSEHVQMLLIRV